MHDSLIIQLLETNKINFHNIFNIHAGLKKNEHVHHMSIVGPSEKQQIYLKGTLLFW